MRLTQPEEKPILIIIDSRNFHFMKHLLTKLLTSINLHWHFVSVHPQSPLMRSCMFYVSKWLRVIICIWVSQPFLLGGNGSNSLRLWIDYVIELMGGLPSCFQLGEKKFLSNQYCIISLIICYVLLQNSHFPLQGVGTFVCLVLVAIFPRE